MNTQSITLDVSKKPAIMPTLRIGQGDKNGTTIQATIYDNGVPLSLSGYSVRFEMRLPDGTSYYQSPDGTISGNVATIPIDETYAGAVDGITKIAYIVVYSNSVVCSTSRINVIVLESAEEGADAAHAYSSGIIEATNAANAAAASATSAASSATTAAANADAKAGLADSAATAANSAASTATAAASTASSNAAAANSAASQANSAATTANSAAAAANDATEDTEAATAAALAAIEAMGDISELAVPEMSANIRGGAKLGVGLDVSDGRLNIDLSDSGSGSSVLTNGCALLDVEGDGWAEQDGTPTPENPQEVRVAKGRNLIPIDAGLTKTANGVTATQNADGSVSLSGTATANADLYAVYGAWKSQSNLICEKGETYTISAYGIGNGVSARILFFDSSSIVAEKGISTDGGSGAITVPNTATGMAIRLSVASGTTVSGLAKVQLELGSTATPYVPYGHVGLEIKQGSTLIDCIPVPIPEEGLASVRDGTKDLLAIDSAGHVLAGKRVQRLYFDGTDSSGWLAEGSYASTGGGYYRYDNRAYGSTAVVTASGFRSNYFNNIAVLVSAQDNAGKIGIGNTYALPRIRTAESTAPQTVETLMAQFQANPFELFLPLATPTTIDLGYIDLPLMPDGCTVSIPELHNIGVEWLVTGADGVPQMELDERKRTLHEIALAGDAELSTIAAVENATASTNYAVGSYLVHAGTLYRVTTAIATGETITPGSNVTATTVMAEVLALVQ